MNDESFIQNVLFEDLPDVFDDSEDDSCDDEEPMPTTSDFFLTGKGYLSI